MIELELTMGTAEKLASVLLGAVNFALDPNMENLFYDLEAFGVVPKYDLENGQLIERSSK